MGQFVLLAKIVCRRCARWLRCNSCGDCFYAALKLHSGTSPAGLATRMAERLKVPVLKSDPAHSGKFLKTNQILKPANNLRLFSPSPDFTHF